MVSVAITRWPKTYNYANDKTAPDTAKRLSSITMCIMQCGLLTCLRIKLKKNRQFSFKRAKKYIEMFTPENT